MPDLENYENEFIVDDEMDEGEGLSKGGIIGLAAGAAALIGGTIMAKKKGWFSKIPFLNKKETVEESVEEPTEE